MPLHRAGFLPKYTRLGICGSIKYRLEAYMVDTNMIPNDLKELTYWSLLPTCDTWRATVKVLLWMGWCECFIALWDLTVQWLRLCTSTARGMSLIPVWELRSLMPLGIAKIYLKKWKITFSLKGLIYKFRSMSIERGQYTTGLNT